MVSSTLSDGRRRCLKGEGGFLIASSSSVCVSAYNTQPTDGRMDGRTARVARRRLSTIVGCVKSWRSVALIYIFPPVFYLLATVGRAVHILRAPHNSQKTLSHHPNLNVHSHRRVLLLRAALYVSLSVLFSVAQPPHAHKTERTTLTNIYQTRPTLRRLR